ncbi:MAG TPA: 4Fe-4S dicluster domain-containing protein [Jiangellaceae bacterium]
MQDSQTGPQLIARTIGVGEPAAAWGKVIDQSTCIGCHACTTACKSENDVPLSVNRTFVKSVDVGIYPEARRSFQVTRCNQCTDAPCVAACPTSAMFTRPDGIVDFDKSACIGCKACMAACPYDAIFINPEDHSAEKCNFCAHRLDMGLEPACVVVCPTQSIMVGDLNDPDSRVAQYVNREPVTVRRPEKNTKPKLYYKDATEFTLDPLAAGRPPGDTFAWTEQPRGRHVVSGPTTPQNSSAAAVISYDVAHRAPWDWRVSLYTWTKGIASGAYLVPLLLLMTGWLDASDGLWVWSAPVVAATFLAITAGLLVWDLDHPARFFYILTRPQWRSWLVRGGVILAGFAAALGVHLLGSLFGVAGLRTAAAVVGLPLSVLAAVYTAYLFAQAKARDLWQNPLLPPHLAVQAALSGAAAMLLIATWSSDADVVTALGWVLGGASLLHLLFVLGEVTLPHVTGHARQAGHEMVAGRYGRFFWAGVVLVAVGLLAPWLGAWVALPALAGLALHEHAYVQAGQSVPLA